MSSVKLRVEQQPTSSLIQQADTSSPLQAAFDWEHLFHAQEYPTNPYLALSKVCSLSNYASVVPQTVQAAVNMRHELDLKLSPDALIAMEARDMSLHVGFDHALKKGVVLEDDWKASASKGISNVVLYKLLAQIKKLALLDVDSLVKCASQQPPAVLFPLSLEGYELCPKKCLIETWEVITDSEGGGGKQ